MYSYICRCTRESCYVTTSVNNDKFLSYTTAVYIDSLGVLVGIHVYTACGACIYV